MEVLPSFSIPPPVHPPTDPCLCRGKKIYEPPRFMTVAQAADQLVQIVQRRRGEGEELGEERHFLGWEQNPEAPPTAARVGVVGRLL